MSGLYWNRNKTAAELNDLLSVLAEEFPLSAEKGDRELIFIPSGVPGKVKVANGTESTTVEYGRISDAARGIGMALAGLNAIEKNTFSSFGIMLDCSRNAVMTVSHFKRWLRRIALMGYNQAMLYTEDIYRLPDEPWFGYLRGPYSMEDMKEIDAFARKLGIEMIACIQTLGHMEQILRLPVYKEIRDTPGVLLVDEPKTYELVEKMIAFWNEAFSSRRINIGMDEALDLGRGRFMDKSGYEPGIDIFDRHLGRVKAICAKYGLKPMMWSDMYFAIGNEDKECYSEDSIISEEVKKKIPGDVDLVFWDYYHREESFYANWIRRHRELGCEPLVGSAVWTWSRWWYDKDITEATAGPCLNACIKAGVKEVLITLWGGGGAHCEFDSCLAGLCWSADLAFGGDGDPERTGKLFAAVTGGNYHHYQTAGELELYVDNVNCSVGHILCDDPLLGKWYKKLDAKDGDLIRRNIEHCRELSKRLYPMRNDTAWADLNHAWLISELVGGKLLTMKSLYDAYERKDREALRRIMEVMVPETLEKLKAFMASFRKQWLRRNKPFGLEAMQVLFGGMLVRWDEVALRLKEYLEGDIDSIPELDENGKRNGVRI